MRAVVAGWLLTALLCGIGCATSKSGDDAGPAGDAGGTTDASRQPDAGAGAPVPPGQEVVSGAGRLQGGSIVMEAEVGHWMDQTRASAGTRTVEGAAVIKP